MSLKILFAACAAQALSASAATAADLTITVDGLRTDQGNVLVCVFDAANVKADEFPDCDKGNAVRKGKLPIKSGIASVTYTGLKEGVYAVAIVHDENANGQLDTNFLGIPEEGLGVSTNPRLFGSKPKFNDGRFELRGKLTITITAKYFL
jgi:uncharacterized protein (DUF2141 family)